MAESIAGPIARARAPEVSDVSTEVRLFWGFFGFVAFGGPTIGLLIAASRWDQILSLTSGQALIAVLLTLVAASSNRVRFSVGRQVHANVSTAAAVAMMILLPIALPGLLMPIAKAAAELFRRRENRTDPLELAFNVGQSAWCAVTGALAFAATNRFLSNDVAWLREPALLVATAAGFAALHVVNTGLVAGIAGLQLRHDPRRLWAISLRDSSLGHATMATVAFAAACLIEDHPLAMAALIVPLVLVHRALRASAQLREDVHAALDALTEVVELRDPYTAGHSRRVAEMARTIALRLGLTPEEADCFADAGRVHDIGKVAIDPDVLAKPGRLDPGEWAEMRRHPELGAEVIALFAAYGDGHLLVRHHHEAWDGSGYPDGLAGDDIPLGARILAVADTFDALTSDRPYRPRVDVERALSVLIDGAGRQWDPLVVEALVAHVRAACSPTAALSAEVRTLRIPAA